MDEKTLATLGITTETGKYPFPVLNVQNPLGSAKISCYGGHVLSFAPAGERQVLWMSEKSLYQIGKPMRGGVPVCWPWFGGSPVKGRPSHGLARIAMWKIQNAEKLADSATRVTLALDDTDCDPALCDFPFHLELAVTVGRALEMELRSFNTGKAPQTIQGALHTYFAVNEASRITLHGLDGVPYLDKAADHAGENAVMAGDLEIDREIDRVFCPTQSTVTIADPDWRRTIRVEKTGSFSTVVWNPWIAKSRAMADYGDNEYHKMVCVECCNALADARTIAPGEMSAMTQKISVEKWD